MKAVTHVSIFKQSPDAPPVAMPTFESGFEYTRALRPSHSDRQWCEGLARFLERRIRRFPKDLSAHVQRVNALVAARADGDHLYAAAIDLNTVLAGNGAALQQRILDQISFALDAQQRAGLVAMLAGSSTAACPAELHGSLPHSNVKHLRIVSEIKHDPNGHGGSATTENELLAVSFEERPNERRHVRPLSPTSDETTSHSTKLAKDASQVVGYPPAGESGVVSLRDAHVNKVSEPQPVLNVA